MHRTSVLTTLLVVFAATAVPTNSFLAPAHAVEDVAPSAEFEDARLRDEVRGQIAEAGTPVHVEFYAPPGAKLSLLLRPDTKGETPTGADGLSLELCGPDGQLIPVAGTKADKSKPEKDLIRWRGVPIEQGGVHQLIVDASIAGGFRLVLSGTGGRQKLSTESDGNLLPGNTEELRFEGATGAKVTLDLRRMNKQTFVGEVVAVLRPDGTELVPEDSDPGVRKLVLDADGEHRILFRNGANTGGGWRSTINVRSPAVKKRRAFLPLEGSDVALVPRVQRVTPDKAFHRDRALELTLTGRDFQPGLDVRLTRKGRTDIVATAVQVLSETEITCLVDLDTKTTTGETSIGKWKVGVFNAPTYSNPEDVLTLEKDTFTSHRTKTLESRSAGSITLPQGISDDTEVWWVNFVPQFQDDLDRVGLGSENPEVRALARAVVEGYVIAYLRDVFGQNETNGSTGNGVRLSFVVTEPPEVAGEAGVDYNRIDVGGNQRGDLGDPDQADASLEWGFSPFDDGNQSRESLVFVETDDEGVETRVGHGARLQFLDPLRGGADASFIEDTTPLRNTPLRGIDRIFFSDGFRPRTTAEATRYGDIVLQIERVSREYAAVVAHHIGRCMGVASGGGGPMATPTTAGGFWEERNSLSFVTADLTTMRSQTVPHQLPGRSKRLVVNFLPLRSMVPLTSAQNFVHVLPDLTTDVEYTAELLLVGGRPNALPEDYRLRYIIGSDVPIGLERTFTDMTGTIPTLTANSTLNCLGRPHVFQFAIEDRDRNSVWFSIFRLNVLPNLAVVPTQLRAQAQSCTTAILNTP